MAVAGEEVVKHYEEALSTAAIPRLASAEATCSLPSSTAPPSTMLEGRGEASAPAGSEPHGWQDEPRAKALVLKEKAAKKAIIASPPQSSSEPFSKGSMMGPDIFDEIKEGMMESHAAAKALAKVLRKLGGAVEPTVVVSDAILTEIFIPTVSCYCALYAVATEP